MYITYSDNAFRNYTVLTNTFGRDQHPVTQPAAESKRS